MGADVDRCDAAVDTMRWISPACAYGRVGKGEDETGQRQGETERERRRRDSHSHGLPPFGHRCGDGSTCLVKEGLKGKQICWEKKHIQEGIGISGKSKGK
uniref:Uncharacterized protein n=1 Tax=Vitrella brassicaformis TaxID=1169539 RepID=A0A7S1KCI9_9ALVE|mmetsp:Transcript_47946/g.119978  ORF Transcript_47946/g.119978 Transcript_47946/m.119978 type:complete len:100 (+) Transcript_47946:239-538(+)